MASLQLPNSKKKSAAHKNGFEVLVVFNVASVLIKWLLRHPIPQHTLLLRFYQLKYILVLILTMHNIITLTSQTPGWLRLGVGDLVGCHPVGGQPLLVLLHRRRHHTATAQPGVGGGYREGGRSSL